MHLKKLEMAVCIAVGALAMALPVFSEQTNDRGQGHAIVTVLPATGRNASVNLLQENLQLEVNGKKASITHWKPLPWTTGNLELVILIDGSSRATLGRQLDDISEFIRDLPANVKVAVGYMEAGRAVMAAPLSTDHAEVAGKLGIPGGVVGANASPYFCLSDLARKWPSEDLSARREVVLITNGVDNYYEGYNTEDPYLKSAIRDSVRARLVIYSIYMPNRGRGANSGYRNFEGQSMLADVTRATGGYSYWDGTGREPVSFRPYLNDIAWRLQNQYQLSFQSRLTGKPELQNLKLKVENQEVEVVAPRRVLVAQQGEE